MLNSINYVKIYEHSNIYFSCIGGFFVINIGEYNKLQVVRKADFGYFLSSIDDKNDDEILIHNNNIPSGELSIDSIVDVFVYRDSEDRLTATLKEPLAKAFEIAYLKVVSKTPIGDFIDIGLDRDILVPKKEQTIRLEENKKYLFYIYVDKTKRLAATTDIDRYLENTTEYKVGDEVNGIAYGIQSNGSIMVAVYNMYRGVILRNEYFTNINMGDELTLRVKKHYEDGKMSLTPRKMPKEERLELEDVIHEYLKSNNGFMPYNDKTSPDIIRQVFHTSKKYFKNALGGLMKQGLIEQTEDGTRLI